MGYTDKYIEDVLKLQMQVEDARKIQKQVEDARKIQKQIEDARKIQKQVEDARKIQKQVEDARMIQKQIDDALAFQKQVEYLTPKIPEYLMPVIPTMPPMPVMPRMDGHLASGFYERLTSWINDFEDGLDDHTEVGVRLVSFGQTITFHLSDISYWNPQLIRFDGIDLAGQPVQLIQHVSQISVLLMKVPKLGETAKRIGFRKDDE